MQCKESRIRTVVLHVQLALHLHSPQVDVIGSDLEGIVKTIPYEHESVEMASLPKVLHTH